MNDEITIGDRRVGANEPCYIVAEAGSNHNSDLDRARRLVDVAAKAGVDAVKFQSIDPDALYQDRARDEDTEALLDDIAFPETWHRDLASHARDRGVAFLSTPTYPRAVEILDELDAPAIKIASLQTATDPRVIEAAARTGRPVILSTGLVGIEGLASAIEIVREAGGTEVAVLHCVSRYPTDPEEAHLRVMDRWRDAFQLPVGFSDHTLGTTVTLAAVARGADLVETHFTLDRDLEGPDHHFALEPDELNRFVDEARSIEAALGRREGAGLGAEEQALIDDNQLRLCAARDLSPGDPLGEDAIRLLRGDDGIPARTELRAHALRHEVSQKIPAGAPIEWEALEYSGGLDE